MAMLSKLTRSFSHFGNRILTAFHPIQSSTCILHTGHRAAYGLCTQAEVVTSRCQTSSLVPPLPRLPPPTQLLVMCIATEQVSWPVTSTYISRLLTPEYERLCNSARLEREGRWYVDNSWTVSQAALFQHKIMLHGHRSFSWRCSQKWKGGKKLHAQNA